MKKIIIYIFILTAFASYGQQIPNADFENWDNAPLGTEDKPTDWNTVNSSLGIFGGTIGQTCFQSTDANSGIYCINLKTIDPPLIPSGNPDINGIASTGDVQTTSPYGVTGGIPFTDSPDSLVGYYKYFPTGSDIGTIEMVLKDATEDTIAHARFETPSISVNQYTRFSVPFDYRNSSTPTLAVHLLSSSDGYNPVVGSQIWIDDLELIYNPVINSVVKLKETRVEVYYAANQLYIDNPEHEELGNILVYSAMGRHVETLSTNQLSTANLPLGFYTYVIPVVGITGKFMR